MSTVKKGVLTKPQEWAQHFRKWGKRQFWSKERKAAQREIAKEKT